MGQKINPTGFRLAVSRNWASRWYASNRDFAGMLAEDIKVREYLKTKLKNASVSRVLIERPAKNARITIFSARPGVVIGKKGEDIENLKRDLGKQLGVPVRNFGFAGLKDHRAVTCQQLTVRGVPSSSLLRASHPHFRIGKARRVQSPLKLGQLGGNRFRILLRDVRGDAKRLRKALSALRKLEGSASRPALRGAVERMARRGPEAYLEGATQLLRRPHA